MATPDYQDAMLTLKLYELRREAVMRQSRSMIMKEFWPKSIDDVLVVTKPDHPLNAAFRQTSSYWEMVYGMAKHGIADPDYLIENNGEGLFLYAKVFPFLAEYRKQYSPNGFINAEWISTHCTIGEQRFAQIRTRVQAMAQAAGK